VAILRYNGAPEQEPLGTPIYNYLRTGLQMNALNRGTGHNDTISIAELTSADLDDPELLRVVPDYKFYIFYDFYRKDNPNFHVPGLYGFNQGELIMLHL
jgi:L-ascorbate oxidase